MPLSCQLMPNYWKQDREFESDFVYKDRMVIPRWNPYLKFDPKMLLLLIVKSPNPRLDAGKWWVKKVWNRFQIIIIIGLVLLDHINVLFPDWRMAFQPKLVDSSFSILSVPKLYYYLDNYLQFLLISFIHGSLQTWAVLSKF